ncbi:MAG TPA: hypothetical protein ENO18_02400, partial [Caldithrix sp.]|nr:hypothetical protein [Caldithrix sp.]
MKKHFKLIIICTAVVLASVIAITTYLYKDTFRELNRITSERKLKKDNEILQMQLSFQKKPNVEDSGILMAEYFNKKDFEKALYYGNKCIELGVNDTRAGFWVNYVMAKIYKETNQYDLANKYLNIAIALD